MCLKCLAGTISNNGLAQASNSCIPCPAGHMSEFDGSAVCTGCGQGRYQDLKQQVGVYLFRVL